MRRGLATAVANRVSRSTLGLRRAFFSTSEQQGVGSPEATSPQIPQQPVGATSSSTIASQQPEVVPLRPAASAPPAETVAAAAPAADLSSAPSVASINISGGSGGSGDGGSGGTSSGGAVAGGGIAGSITQQVQLRADQTITRHLKLDAVVAATTPRDFIVAKHEVASIYSYAGYVNFTAHEVASRLLVSPAPQRTFHALIGRGGIPCDFYGDVDMDLAERNPEAKLIEALHAVKEQLAERGFGALETLVLTGNSNEKHSFHVHIHSPAMAFADFREVAEVAEVVNDALPAPIFDTGVYRANATLRLALSAKLGQADRVLTPYLPVAKDAALRSILASAGGLSSTDLVVRSLVLRPELRRAARDAATPAVASVADDGAGDASGAAKGGSKGKKHAKGKAVPAASGAATAADECPGEATTVDGVKIFNSRNFRRSHGGDAGSAFTRAMPQGAVRAMRNGRRVSLVPDESGANLVPAFLAPTLKWKRYQEVRRKLLAMPDNFARDYDTWANVGLALHSFASRGEREPFEDFVSFSAMCPFKFDRKVVEKKWKGFGVKATERTTRREEDVFTWRRGYNYLNKTIWRSNKG